MTKYLLDTWEAKSQLSFTVDTSYLQGDTYQSSLANILDTFFKLGFTSCKAELLLQGIELQEKEAQKD